MISFVLFNNNLFLITSLIHLSWLLCYLLIILLFHSLQNLYWFLLFTGMDLAKKLLSALVYFYFYHTNRFRFFFLVINTVQFSLLPIFCWRFKADCFLFSSSLFFVLIVEHRLSFFQLSITDLHDSFWNHLFDPWLMVALCEQIK